MPSINDVIAQRLDAIVEQWSAAAGESASARGLSKPALANILPRYLAALADPTQVAHRRVELVERHVAARIREGFRVDEVVQEIAILRDVIARECAADAQAHGVAPQGMDAVEAELHRASVAIATIFAQHMAEDEQAEKRFVRQLQAITSEVPEGTATHQPLRARLASALEMIMEAMGAQSAALLLFDPTHGTLETAASTGLASELLEHYAVNVEGPSFAAKLAHHEEEPSSVLDAETTELEIPPALRKSGIHALLGVRLPARHRLVGVLYIGLSARREFSASEDRRLEALGEQLTLHLDNAFLFRELRARVTELEQERVLRDRFISALSHDLRGPLTVARTSAQLVDRSHELKGTLTELPNRIMRSIDRADRMVRDLLDALRIRAGQPLALALADCDLVSIARAVASEMTALHGEHFVVAGDSRVEGHWSADDLQRAIWNLVSNAVKYGQRNGTVTITARRNATGAEVSVHNEGPVIPEEDRARLFVPFSQLGAVNSTQRHGWGLGLTLVQGCAAAHGGSVSVESTASEGTTFTIRLPLEVPADLAAASRGTAPEELD